MSSTLSPVEPSVLALPERRAKPPHGHERKHSHEKVSNSIHTSKRSFPLNNYFKQIEPKKQTGKVAKSVFMMVSNLLPALSASEVLDSLGDSLNMESLAKHLKPASAIWIRQLLIDGVTKENYGKPIAATVSAHALIAANEQYGLPRALLRPMLGLFLFAIEEFENLKQVFTGKKASHDHEKHDHSKCNHSHEEHKHGSCNHTHKEHDHSSCSHSHDNDHHDHSGHNHTPPSFEKLGIGLGMLELQLNTVAPLVSIASGKLFTSDGALNRTSKVLFNTGSLAVGFVGLGEGIRAIVNALGKTKHKVLESLVANIESTVCACCGTMGGCATAVAEDVTATANLY